MIEDHCMTDVGILMSKDLWCVYLLECADGTYYCGVSNDLESRVKSHNSNKGAKYTKGRGPVKVVGIIKNLTKSNALKVEYAVKSLKRKNKLAYFQKGIMYDGGRSDQGINDRVS
jgi:putative endonuclease